MIPTDLSGCTVWLDASQLALADDTPLDSQWSDLSGANHHGTIYGSPAPVVKTNVLGGKRIVQFAANEGRVRGDTALPIDHTGNNFSVFYVGRMIGPTSRRLFSATYLPRNFLLGYWQGIQEVLYAGSFTGPQIAISSTPTPWRIWGCVGSSDGPAASSYTLAFYMDGTTLGGGGGFTESLGTRYNLSGYDATGTEETSDAQVAELIVYSRSLTGSERVQIEDYLKAKWTEWVPSAAPEFLGIGQLTSEILRVVTPQFLSTGQLTTSISRIERPQFLSTGQLTAEIFKVPGPEPEGGGGIWSTDPFPPKRKYGKSWSTSPVATVLGEPRGGWFALLEKLAAMGGVGNLSTIASPRIKRTSAFLSDGVLTPVINPRNYCDASLSGNGLPTGKIFEIRNTTAFFVGGGKFDAIDINDGLIATVRPGLAANFIGGSELASSIVGGIQYPDGLSALAWERYLYPAYFASQGQLLANLGEFKLTLVELIGSGALTTNVKQLYPLMLQLVSAGQLSISTFEVYQKLLNLLGTGQLSATGFAQYLTSVGFDSAGSLIAILLASYPSPAPAGGVGTITALIMQKYLLQPNLNGSGTLIAGVTSLGSTEMSFGGDGELTAEIQSPEFILAELLGTGQLSVQMFERYLSAMGISGAGNLVAQLLELYSSATSSGGSGTISFIVKPKYLFPVNLSGNGLLVALAWRSERVSATLSGSGQFDATWLQKYLLNANFVGGGILSAPETYDASFPDGLSARVSRGYRMFLDGNGILSILASQKYNIAMALQGEGTLNATGTAVYSQLAMLSGTGNISAAAIASYSQSAALSGIGSASATATASYSQSAALSGGGSLSATAVIGFTPTIEENTARTNQAVPVGATEWLVRLLGGGAAGGKGAGTGFAGSARGGGGGGGGGALIDTDWKPVSQLGSTYSVTVPASSTGAGNDAIFTSGSVSLTANGGNVGGNGSGATAGAVGTGGTAVVSGTTATTATGSSGGIGGAGAGGNGATGGTNASGAGPGGGGGGGVVAVAPGGNGNGGAGGNSATVSGGAAQTTATGAVGNNGTAGATGNAGGAGGGGRGGNSDLAGFAGGNGATAGAGGGGSSGTYTTNKPIQNGGNGSAGYTKVQFR